MDGVDKTFARRDRGTDSAKAILQHIASNEYEAIRGRKAGVSKGKIDSLIYKKCPFAIIEDEESIYAFALCGSVTEGNVPLFAFAEDKDPDLAFLGTFKKEWPNNKVLLQKVSETVREFYSQLKTDGRGPMTAFLNKQPTSKVALKKALTPEVLRSMGTAIWIAGSTATFQEALHVKGVAGVICGAIIGTGASAIQSALKARDLMHQKAPELHPQPSPGEILTKEQKTRVPLFFTTSHEDGSVKPEGPEAVKFVDSLPVCPSLPEQKSTDNFSRSV